MSALLKDWAEANVPNKELYYAAGYTEQIDFIQDRIARLVTKSYEEYLALQDYLTVIADHMSKSVRLPVIRMELEDGTVFVMRHNFNDWKVSVNSPRDFDADFMELFDPKKAIHGVYCEGFPPDLVYGPYAENKRQFTIMLPGNYHVFTFFWIYARRVQSS